FLNQKGAGILEVVTPAKVNDQILKDYFKKIAERFKLLEKQETR
ncbi:MAG: hypothetical protein ACI9O2_001182, partial [Flammeovirgaceae bacterium]